MTHEIATIVASMLRSSDLFQVNSGEVWIPDLDNYAFSMQEHLTRALELHGYSASASTRDEHGMLITVRRAERIDSRLIKRIHSNVYGYTGRVTEVGVDVGKDRSTSSYVIRGTGNILQIPEIGWTDGRERVVIGYNDGLRLAEVGTDNVTTYTSEDTFQIENPTLDIKKELSLQEMADESRVIVFKGEWTGSPQARFL